MLLYEVYEPVKDQEKDAEHDVGVRSNGCFSSRHSKRDSSLSHLNEC